MPIEFKNKRVVKADDKVVGLDHRGCVVHGTAVKGDTAKGHPELVFLHGVHKTVCPSLELHHFLHVDDAEICIKGVHKVTAKAKAPDATDHGPLTTDATAASKKPGPATAAP